MSQQDWLEKDYYATLGLKKTASADQIKKSFRKLAREFHPDQNKDPKAEQRFKEITEAHDILGDPKKRKEYDEARSLFGSGGFRFPGASGGGGFRQTEVNLDDLLGGSQGGFGDLFSGLFSGSARASSRGPRRGRDTETEATLTFLQAAHGTTASVRLSSETACKSCHGTGAKAGTSPRMCPTCQGSGMVARQSGGFGVSEPCAACHGRGLMIDELCPDCAGTGRELSSHVIQARIPAGVTDGQKIRVKGRGGRGANGGADGDLYVFVHVKPDPLFTRSGENLAVTVPVTFAEAALGATIDVPTLEGGRFSLKIPAGTRTGRTFRAKGKGIEMRSGATDLLVTIEVQVPAQLSPEARSALEEYTRLAGESDTRQHLWRKK